MRGEIDKEEGRDKGERVTYGRESAREKNHGQGRDGFHGHAIFLRFERDASGVVGDGDVGAGVELGD